MARVPEMTFCKPIHPPPSAVDVQHLSPAERAKKRFSLEGKCAVGELNPSSGRDRNVKAKITRGLYEQTVTGGARGLGLTIAEGLLEHEAAAVALLDLDEKEGQQALQKLHLLFPKRQDCIIFRPIDVTDADVLGKTVHEIAENFGKIDVLVCFAGIVNSVRALDYTPESFRKICDVNTVGTFLTAQAVGREMITRKNGGSIVLTASMAGHIVNYPQTHVAYGTSKAGVHHMTHCLAAEWAKYEIRVNSLSPGYMDTRLNASDDLTDVLPTWFERTPMGRMGLKEELIGAVVLLASSAGGFMTGSDLRVDGGYTLF